MTRLVPVLAASLFVLGCRVPVAPDEPDSASDQRAGSEPIATKPSAEPSLWLEAEHFEAAERQPPIPARAPPLPGFDTTPVAHQLDPDGLEWTDYTSGAGPSAGPGSQLRFDYVGALLDGQVFDSTYERNLPFEYELGRNQIIEGLERGLVGVRTGMRRAIVIPPALGYGESERPTIPANSTLVFYVEVLSVN